MSADAFEKNNLGWQVQQLQQRVSEWLELKWSPNFPSLPDVSLPSWVEKVAFWLILGLLLTWLGLQLSRLLRPYIYSLANLELGSDADRGTPTTVEERAAAWLRRSHEFQGQGNYREACRCLYMAMLQRLNDTGIALHQPSRTDGEYLQLTQQLPTQRSYQILVNTHEQLCFGNAEIGSEDFERCSRAYRDVEGK